MITIILNGKPQPVDTDITINKLINQLQLQDKRLAIEINQQIIPRSTFAQHQLQHNDTVEIIQAIGGG